jgi:hypothetical protein
MRTRTRISDWPLVQANISPRTMERLEEVAEERALSVAALVREAVDRVYRPEAAVRP